MARVFVFSLLLVVVALLLLQRNDASGTNEAVTEVVQDVMSPVQVTEILEPPSTTTLGDKYCCIRNGFGCVQECDSSISYECCLRNGFGCQQMCDKTKTYFCCLKNVFGCQQRCENGYQYYCCKKNGLGSCVGMCPKSVSLKQVVDVV